MRLVLANLSSLLGLSRGGSQEEEEIEGRKIVENLVHQDKQSDFVSKGTGMPW